MITIQRNRIAALSLCAALAAPNITSAVSVSGQGTWETTLQPRDLDGNVSTVEAYYDTVLNITWLVDANYAQTSGYDLDGRIDWASANNWVESLSVYEISSWRLPRMIDTLTTGCNFSTTGGTDCGYNVQTVLDGSVYSEMATLYYETLANTGYYDPSGSYSPSHGLSNTGPFINFQAGVYWSQLAVETDPARAWRFFFSNGGQDDFVYKDSTAVAHVLIVHDGDVGLTTVPVPAAAWLFSCGLIGLLGVSRNKH